jgi:hypothetical protein
MNKEKELSNYFDLTIPGKKLLSKGDAIEGEHGIQEVEGEFYVTEYHLLKNGVAGAKIRGYITAFIEKNGKFGLSNKAKEENTDHDAWPRVVYSNAPQKFTKYKLSWLVETFIYPNEKFAKEIAICRDYIGESAEERFSNLVKNTSSSSDDKLNEIRIILESWVKSMKKRCLIPDCFVDSDGAKVASTLSFLSGNFTYNYLIHEDSIFPKPVTTMLEYLLRIGHEGSHDNDPLYELMKNEGFKSLQRANTLLLIDLVNWYKTYLDNGPKTSDWSRIESEELLEGEVIEDKVNKFFFKAKKPFKKIFIPNYVTKKNKIHPGLKIKVKIKGVWKTGTEVKFIP